MIMMVVVVRMMTLSFRQMESDGSRGGIPRYWGDHFDCLLINQSQQLYESVSKTQQAN